MATQPHPGPPPLATEYFLKTHPLSQAATHASLYLRLHGDGILSVVCTPTSPKFLRWTHVAEQEIATLWNHPERSFRLTLSPPRVKYGWEEVSIVSKDVEVDDKVGNKGFIWEIDEEGREILRFGKEVYGKEEGVKAEWKGWMVCTWMLGHPQLFWVTGLSIKEEEMPSSCERVDIVREWLIPKKGE